MKIKIKLLLIIITILLLNVGCSKYYISKEQLTNPKTPLNYIEETHYRNENYGRTFKMSKIESNSINIGFLSDMLTDDEMTSTAYKIQNDIKTINEYLSIDNSNNTLTLYILDELIDDQVITTTQVAYVTADMISDDSYYIPLLQAYLELNEPWKLNGLYSIIFTDTQENIDLTEYYSNTEDLSILGLFGARFNTTFNTPNDIEIAKSTASSLTQFILDKYDYNTLVTNNTSLIREEWLESIGVSKPFTYQYETDYNNFSFSQSEDYPLIVITNDASYYIIPFEDTLETCNDVEQFIFNDITGREQIRNYILANATIQSEAVLEKNHFYYYLGNYDISYANYPEIHLERTDKNLHEATHLMIKSSKLWVSEGIAEYMSNCIVQDPFSCESVNKFMNNLEEEYTLQRIISPMIILT